MIYLLNVKIGKTTDSCCTWVISTDFFIIFFYLCSCFYVLWLHNEHQVCSDYTVFKEFNPFHLLLFSVRRNERKETWGCYDYIQSPGVITM